MCIICNNQNEIHLQRDDEVDVRLLIHQSLAGCIIGKGGQKIKEIRDVSTQTPSGYMNIFRRLWNYVFHLWDLCQKHIFLTFKNINFGL